MDNTTPPLSGNPGAGRRKAPGRRKLLLVALLFAAPILVALALRAAGWHPQGMRNEGTLIDPPVAVADVPPRRIDGGTLDWPVAERGWNVLALAPQSSCGDDCAELFDTLHRVWLTQGRHADRVRVLWAGALPPEATQYAGLVPVALPPDLRARLPDDEAAPAPVYLVDSRGFVALRYAHGFDPSGLRKDLARLLK